MWYSSNSVSPKEWYHGTPLTIAPLHLVHAEKHQLNIVDQN